MIRLLIAFLLSFALSVILMPLVIKFFKKKSANQTILGYVENHKEKNGTTTMGGVIFIINTLLLAFVFLRYDTTWFMTLMISVFFGVLGLMDDYLKVKYRQNLGLRPYQKIIGQLGISIIFALFVYFSYQGGNIFIPFTENSFDIKFWVIPLVVVVLIASSNSVNLTDGLDGLAGKVSLIYLVMFTIITSLVSNHLYQSGETGQILSNIQNINILSMLFAGAILGFLMFNTSKASIFMGDVGSLCLGGYIGAAACVLGMELILPILGFCFVFSAISVILQVAVFKLKKRRVFKMAPFHHHLQMSGLSEPKIVAIYSAITLCIGIICIIFYLL
ncbi:MAG TPA: phospho-N-acetylmuramoyl-pentapeptide-transferase [Candidatus Onthoplasma faecigallinarum]|nr:phospho-N-acetylmuramoyl-pentapeptide-transferase [Candidatus Onthoplasma faecigallinarum]